MRLFASVATFSIAASSAALAAEALYNTPIYNPATKSYFELYSPDPSVLHEGNLIQHITWNVAKKMAERRKYHGTPGRLAVVKTRQVHEFLRDRFQPDHPAWIGLRYWCYFKKLQWVTGEVYPVTAFAKWGRVWNEGAIYPGQKDGQPAWCDTENKHSGMHGVHYWSMSQGFFWNANGQDKYFSAMFIEYPTGKP